ncbi:hypothetical protein QNI19_08610 [Cytophagaceae bacterium DM2B3-1]|uniref:Uncharacterized protein n=1 Tax=Xanthocytophaga flava TaxID=3048013 RepID=A0AAE3U783_9BACT|nr:hypothetical protein [Xanthocytophaga flavus]MDJ1471026.1 hypothetical protein [Xanthocytophaga flavus]MDJ1482654.1 hypothetical protein [Xanthocytophaga flavus]MDJ1492991.1 hypothetical protein [Xanthocytophaga flavus]
MKQSIQITPTIRHAMAVMDYWNQNYFEGRYKTEQTLRAEMVLKEAGIDPSQIGITPKEKSGRK